MKPVKADETVLGQARAALIEQLEPRLARSGGGFADEAFIARFGPGLHRLSDAAIVNGALALLIRHVEAQPVGKCGLDWIDNAS